MAVLPKLAHPGRGLEKVLLVPGRREKASPTETFKQVTDFGPPRDVNSTSPGSFTDLRRSNAVTGMRLSNYKLWAAMCYCSVSAMCNVSVNIAGLFDSLTHHPWLHSGLLAAGHITSGFSRLHLASSYPHFSLLMGFCPCHPSCQAPLFRLGVASPTPQPEVGSFMVVRACVVSAPFSKPT